MQPCATASARVIVSAITACARVAARHCAAGTWLGNRPSGHCLRARRELAAGLPRRTGAAAPRRGRLRRFRRADAPRRVDRAPGPGRRRHRDLRATAPNGLSHCEDEHGRPLSGRRRRAVDGGQQHLGVQLPTDARRSDQSSLHAYGRAIDLNPLLNPFIDSSGAFSRSNAAPYLDRSRTDPGMLHDGDPAVRVFTDRGWRWGGDWRTPKDYQHFERR